MRPPPPQGPLPDRAATTGSPADPHAAEAGPAAAAAAASTGGRATAKRLREWLPWLLGLAIVVWLLRRLPLHAVVGALAGGPWATLIAYVAGELLLVLVADAWATAVTLRQCGGSPPFPQVLAMRGATYLLNLVHFAAGQGAFGWYLARAGRSGWSAGGALMVIFVTQGLALLVTFAIGLLLAPMAIAQRALPLALLAFVGVVGYLGVLAWRPGKLARLLLLQPLFAAGLRGHLVALAARLPHMAVLVLLNWGLYRVWGMPVPLRVGLAAWPLLLAVSALPITPAGLGTVQALQVSFFASWAPAPDRAARQAAVLALTLAQYALALLLQAGIGALCLRVLARARLTSPRGTPPRC